VLGERGAGFKGGRGICPQGNKRMGKKPGSSSSPQVEFLVDSSHAGKKKKGTGNFLRGKGEKALRGEKIEKRRQERTILVKGETV